MEIKDLIDVLKEHLEKTYPQETKERKAARELAKKKLMTIFNEYENLSKNIGTSQEQLAAISQLQNILFQLGKIKTPGK